MAWRRASGVRPLVTDASTERREPRRRAFSAVSATVSSVPGGASVARLECSLRRAADRFERTRWRSGGAPPRAAVYSSALELAAAERCVPCALGSAQLGVLVTASQRLRRPPRAAASGDAAADRARSRRPVTRRRRHRRRRRRCYLSRVGRVVGAGRSGLTLVVDELASGAATTRCCASWGVVAARCAASSSVRDVHRCADRRPP